MPYPANYPDAHLRHWEDAERLFEAKRFANADQLYGLSAECGLKAIMVENGMPIDDFGVPTNRRHLKHIHELWETFWAFVEGRPIGDFLHHLPQRNPFRAWSHHHRYAHSSHFDDQAVAPHRKAARQVHQLYLRLKERRYV